MEVSLKKKFIFSLLLLVVLLLYPLSTYAAEVLQVTNSSTILIGDQNRNYTVKIACLEVDSTKENYIIDFLTSELPRHTKVNLRPKGSDGGVLLSRVITIESDNDIGEQILSKGWARNTC